ncbi:hypothetical protein NKG94_39070 [Micromonospora sp. M12]
MRGALRRGWRQLVPIMLLTQVLPAAVLGDQPRVDPSATWYDQTEGNRPARCRTTSPPIWGDSCSCWSAAVCWWGGAGRRVASGTWVISRQAAGQPASLEQALRYGLRRALGLWAGPC